MKTVCKTLSARIYQYCIPTTECIKARFLVDFYYARGTNSSILILVPSEVPVGEKLNQQLINDEEGNVLPEH